MAFNQQIDSLEYTKVEFPYNRIESELSEDIPRFIRGENAYVTAGGKVAKRLGTVALTTPNLAGRVDRLWIYETLDTPPKVYMMASVYDATSGEWSMWYQRRTSTTPAAWAQIPSLRDVNASTRPHEAVSSRGLFFIKGFPDSGSSEKLGTVIFDGSPGTPTTQFWGLLGPQTPARVVGSVSRLTAAIDDVTTSIVVNADTFPAAPFTVVVDYEEMQVTAKAGTTFTVTRGYNNTVAVGHVDNSIVLYRNFSASDHLVQVNLGWRYAYAYKTSTGQISNISPEEENPDLLPSFTGPFADLKPRVTVIGQADTTNIPTIVIYRTTDGGGTYFKLEEISNTGAGSITYTDDSLESGTGGGTFNDPVPDAFLDTADISPSQTSNSPPPTVLAPDVTGTDTPIASTPLASYQGRIWYGLGNVLFYSGEEEIFSGIPEECFPSGIRGNFFRLQYPIVNLQQTTDGLYVVTLQSTYKVTGNSRETFSIRPVFESIGAPYGHPRAITRFGETVALLTHDFRIAMISQDSYQIISEPLFTDLIDQYNLAVNYCEFDIKYWGDLDKSYLVVAGYRKDDPTLTKVWVYDLNKSQKMNTNFWFVPWLIPAVAMVSGRIEENSPQRRMVFYNYDDTAEVGVFARIDPTGRTGVDYAIDPDTGLAAELGISFDIVTHLMTVPPGNHVNTLRKPQLSPCFYGFFVERMVFPGDTEPSYYYYLDDLWTDPRPGIYQSDPPRRPESTGYKTTYVSVNQVCKRAAVQITKLATAELFEIQSLIVSYTPESGA